jgi:hypothetical protein
LKNPEGIIGYKDYLSCTPRSSVVVEKSVVIKGTTVVSYTLILEWKVAQVGPTKCWNRPRDNVKNQIKSKCTMKAA